MVNQPAPTQTLCPRCGAFKASLITLTHTARGIVFQGCGDCLIAELDVLSAYRADQCSTCGSRKVLVIFGEGARRLECPVHVHGRTLILQALRALQPHADHDPGAEQACRELKQALGIQS